MLFISTCPSRSTLPFIALLVPWKIDLYGPINRLPCWIYPVRSPDGKRKSRRRVSFGYVLP